MPPARGDHRAQDPSGPAYPSGPSGAGIWDQPHPHLECLEAPGTGGGGGLRLATRCVREAFQQAGDGPALEVREALEGMAVRLAVPRIARAKIRAWRDSSGVLTARPPRPAYAATSSGPLLSLATSGAGRQRAAHGGAGFGEHDVLCLPGRRGATPAETVPEHRAILKALGRRDPEAAKRPCDSTSGGRSNGWNKRLRRTPERRRRSDREGRGQRANTVAVMWEDGRTTRQCDRRETS